MCKGSSTVTSQSSPAAQAQAGYTAAQTAATAAASQPYQYYPGQLVAGLTGDQASGISAIDNSQNIANPYINASANLTSAATQPIGASQINQYLNPYLGDVASTTSAEVNQNNAVQQNQLQGSAAAQGALGGNRVGIAQAALANQQDMAENSALANIYSTGYSTALGAAQTTNAQQLQGAAEYGSLGSEAQNTALAGANAQLQAGSLEQGQQQNELNAAYSQWAGAQQYPYQSAEYLADIAEGLGSLEGGSSGTTTPPPSEFSQIVGGATSIAGIAGALKKGGRVHRDMGGSSGNGYLASPAGYFPTGTLNGGASGSGGAPAPPAPYSKDASTTTQAGKSGGSSGGGGGLGGIVSMFLKHGGPVGYDGGGGVVPYNLGSVAANDEVGSSHAAGYFPSLGTDGGTRGKGPPQAPQASQGQAQGTSASDVAGAVHSYAQGAQNVANWYNGADAGVGNSMGNNGSDNSVVSHQGGDPTGTATTGGNIANYLSDNWGLKTGGRALRASGGASDSNTTTISAQAAPSIDPSAESSYEEMANYEALSGLMPGSQAPKTDYAQNGIQSPALTEEQGRSSGGLVRARRAAGGGSSLPAFTPVGNQQMTAPQPTSTASSQPATWGNTVLGAAPQLAAYSPGRTTPQMIQNGIALPSGGSQNNYAGYVEGLAGANPSNQNGAPGATPLATYTGTPVSDSMLGGYTGDGGIALKRGGFAHYDGGGGVPQGVGSVVPFSPATPAAIRQQPLSAPQTTNPQQYYKTFAQVQDSIESGGNNNPPPTGTTTAGGAGQFVNGTWEQTVQQTDPGLAAGKTPAQVDALKTDPEIASDMTANYAIQNAQQLTASGKAPTYTNLSLAHRFGAGGANSLLSSDPNTPVEKVLPKEDIAANPDLGGLNVGQVIKNTALEVAHHLGLFQGDTAQNDVQQPGVAPVATDAGNGGASGYANPGQPQLGNPSIPDISSANPVGTPSGNPARVQDIANSPWMALTAAGLGMMAGTSPFPGVNIGNGGLVGLQYLQNTQQNQRANAQVGQEQQTLGLAASGQRQQQENNQAAYYENLLNATPALSDAQRQALQFNYSQSLIGAPTMQVPGIPTGPGLASVGGLPGAAPSGGYPGGGPGTNLGNVPPPGAVPYLQPSASPTTPSPGPGIPAQSGAPSAPTTTTGGVGPVPPSSPTATSDPTQMLPPVQLGNISLPAQLPMQRAMALAPYQGMGGIVGSWATNQAALATNALHDGKFVNQYGQTVNTAGAVGAAAQGSEVQNQVQTEGAGWGDLVQAQPAVSQSLTQLQEIADAGLQAPANTFQPTIAKAASTIAGIAQVLGVTPDKAVTDYASASDLINKINTQLAGNIQKSIGDTAYAGLQTIKAAVPSGSLSSPQSFSQVTRSIAQQLQFSRDMYNYGAQNRQSDLSNNPSDPYSWQNEFLAQNPPQMYASRVQPLPMPVDGKGNPNTAAMKPGFDYVLPSGAPFQWNGSAPQPVDSLGNAAQ